MSAETGRRGELIAYLVLIGLNLLVLPWWFSPGRFALPLRLALIAVSAALIVLCAVKVSGILGVNPFSKSKHPTYAPYAVEEDDDEDADGYPADPFTTARRRRAERERHFGQSEQFQEYDPYEASPDEEPGRD